MKQRVVAHPLMSPDPTNGRSLCLGDYKEAYDTDDSFYENLPEARLANSPAPTVSPSPSTSSNDLLKEKYKSELHFLRDVAPHSSEESLWKLFIKNNYQVDATIDAILVEAAVMEGNRDDQNDTLSNSPQEERPSEAAIKASILSDLRKGQSIVSIMMDIERRKDQQRKVNEASGQTGDRARRGSSMPLPRLFLKIPQYRLILNELSNGYVDFTICIHRHYEKLGMTVKEINSEILVTCLHLNERGEPMIAERAGVQIDDVLLGINGELFSPWPELPDVIELLAVSGPFVVIHLRRKLPMYRVDINDMHPAIKLFLEQRVISKSKAEVVDRLLTSFKHRVVEWNDSTISNRIESWRLDLLDSSPSSVVASSASYREQAATNSSSAGSNGDRRRSLGTLSRSQSEKLRRRVTISATTLSSSLLPSFQTKYIRPALSVRILRAEPSKNGDHTEYVVWVNDIKSGIEWIVRRRFREFFDFRDVS
jgi:hypothetical protein